MVFSDRRQAGRVLATHLERYRGDERVVVAALPRGGVPVGYEVAKCLDAPLDVLVVRKLGMPGHAEFAMGAIASGGVRILNEEARGLAIPRAAIEAVAAREQAELERRERTFRGSHSAIGLEGRIVILVDDGLATGASMRAAVLAARAQRPARVIVAVPVGAPDTCALLRAEADEVICATTPEPFRAVGLWYRDFEQTGDEEVRALLDEASRDSSLSAAR